MNKIYKVIWSKARQCYVVASELARRKGKSRSSSILRLLVAASVALPFLSGNPVFAADMPTTYTKDGITYELYAKYIHNNYAKRSDGTKKYFNGWIYNLSATALRQPN